MRLGIIGSGNVNKNAAFDIIGNFIHSLETENDSINTIVIGGGLRGVEIGAREYATSLGFKYNLELVEVHKDKNAVSKNSDVVLAIWNGDSRDPSWMAIERAAGLGIKVVIIIPEKTRVNQ